MKKNIITLVMVMAMATSALCEPQPLPLETHQNGDSEFNTDLERTPINLPLAVFYDSENNVLEVWCDNDNIQAEVFVYDESGAVEAYSPYMNVSIQLPSSGYHSIILKGDGWEAEGICN